MGFYTVKVKGVASIKGKPFKGGQDYDQKDFKCNNKEFDELLKSGVIAEKAVPKKVASDLEKANESLVKANEELTNKDAELATANKALEAKGAELVKANESLVKANEELVKASKEIETLKAKK